MEPLGVSFSLQIEDQGLDEFDLSAILDPFDSNWFMLCPWAMSLFQSLPWHLPSCFISILKPLSAQSDLPLLCLVVKIFGLILE